MTAKNQDFSMNEGESKEITVADTADEDNGGTLNIRDRQSLTWFLKQYNGGPEVAKHTESGGNITVTDESVGAYTVVIDPADTDGVVLGDEEELYHKVRLADGDGDKSDLLEGTITVHAA